MYCMILILMEESLLQQANPEFQKDDQSSMVVWKSIVAYCTVCFCDK